MRYYIIFAFIVAVFKTIYYIKVEEKEKLRNLPNKVLTNVVLLTFGLSFIIAPLVLIELIIDFIKRKSRRK